MHTSEQVVYQNQISFYEYMKKNTNLSDSFIFSHDHKVHFGFGSYIGLSIKNNVIRVTCTDKDILTSINDFLFIATDISTKEDFFWIETYVEQPFLWLENISRFLYENLGINSSLIGYVGSPGYQYIVSTDIPLKKHPAYTCPDVFFYIPKIEIICEKNKKILVNNYSETSTSNIDKWITDFQTHFTDGLQNNLSEIQNLREVSWEDVTKQVSVVPDDALYKEQVQSAITTLADEKIKKIVISRLAMGSYSLAPSQLFNILRTCSPTHYEYLFEMKEYQIIGCSPEILVKQEGDDITIRTVAGTQVSLADEKQDTTIKQNFLSDPKQIVEHVISFIGQINMMKDQVCVPNSIKVNKILSIDTIAHINHLISEIKGQTKHNVYQTWIKFLPTINGTPAADGYKFALQIEGFNRGIYAGVFGFYNSKQSLFCKMIRTIYLEKETFYVGAGAGITTDSKPDEELLESKNKMRSCLYALHYSKQTFS
ncbi:chorismate-binding protein [Bacillus cereus]|uniref:chorismate-binding protein n=1 Tax=Bacillus cereus TaxID=1396 RepID=UPI000BECB94D|nr:chorismate-binding protein [Bacillus cereus]PEF60801.1 hypothetical protein CON35_28905 [Bacillus cereus]